MTEERAVIYARVSGDDTKKEGRNLAGQIEMGREYCQEHGYTIIAELAEDDRGASGAIWDLPQLSKALEMARADEFDILVVRELDRFARRLAKQLVVESEFKQAGVEVEYVLASYEDTPEGQLTKNVRAIIAEYEREKINERMTRGRRNRIKAGHVVTSGEIPYGYRTAMVDGKQTFEIYEPEAAIVRLIFGWYVDDRLSPKAISEKLADMGISTYRGKARWNPQTLTCLMRKETYCGTWHYGDLTIQVPGIVTRELWESARARAAENKERAKRNRKNQYLLSGRVRCGHCQYKMSGFTTTPRFISYYHCTVKSHPAGYSQVCSGGGYFRADAVESAAWEQVKLWISDPEHTARAYQLYQEEKGNENKPLTDRLALIDNQLEAVKGKLARLLDLRIDGEIDKEIYQDRKSQLAILRAGLEKEKAGIEGTLREQTITQEQLDTALAFAGKIRDRLVEGEQDFEFRTAILDALKIEVVLAKEDGEKVAYVYSDIFGKERISIVNAATNGRPTCTVQAAKTI